MKTLIQIHEEVPPDHYDTGIKNNLLQKIWHEQRFKEVLQITEPTSGRVLDIGCHSGTFTEKIATKLGTKKLYGIDISRSAIKQIRKRIPLGKFKVEDAHNMVFHANFFDVIYCIEVLEHLDNPIKVLSEMKRVLRKGGKVIILVPLNSILFRTIWFIWTSFYPVWKHAHVQSFRGKKLEEGLRSLGFRKIKSKTFNLGMLKLIQCTK